MKICFVLSTVNKAGGANRSLFELLKMLQKNGHECFVLMNRHGSMEDALKSVDAEYKLLPFKSSVKADSALKTLIKKIINIYSKYCIAFYLKRKRIDILHNNSLPTAIGMEAAYKAQVPYICHIRENIWDGLGMEFYHPSKIKNMIRSASEVIVISDYVKRVYQDFVPDASFALVPDSVDAENYYEKKTILENQCTNLLIVGIINPQKGQKDIIKAIEILNENRPGDFYLRIVGRDGYWNGNKDYASSLHRYVEEHCLNNVEFVGELEDHTKLREIRKQSDICVVCSRAEGLGRTTIESMISGNLTIAANAGASPEIIKDKVTGLLYEPGNAVELADQIAFAVEHRNEMRKIADKGQSYAVEEFDQKIYVKKMIDIYERLLNI